MEAAGPTPASPSTGAKTSRSGTYPSTSTSRAKTSTRWLYTVPSLSLMLDPEIEFDEDDPADYALFGVRYMLLPTGMNCPVPAQRASRRRQLLALGYRIEQLYRPRTGHRHPSRRPGRHRLGVLDVPGRAGGQRGLGCEMAGSEPTARAGGLGVTGGVGRRLAGDGRQRPGQPAGRLFGTEVTMDKPGTLVFSVAYDPGWHAWVDGRATRTEMLAPALVGVNLAPGRLAPGSARSLRLEPYSSPTREGCDHQLDLLNRLDRRMHRKARRERL